MPALRNPARPLHSTPHCVPQPEHLCSCAAALPWVSQGRCMLHSPRYCCRQASQGTRLVQAAAGLLLTKCLPCMWQHRKHKGSESHQQQRYRPPKRAGCLEHWLTHAGVLAALQRCLRDRAVSVLCSPLPRCTCLRPPRQQGWQRKSQSSLPRRGGTNQQEQQVGSDASCGWSAGNARWQTHIGRAACSSAAASRKQGTQPATATAAVQRRQRQRQRQS